MADIEYGEAIDGGIPPVGVSIANTVNWLGAVVSVALIAGLTYWGYQLMVRDVSGVPVVRALEGPMRVAPDQPGGENTEHQGLAVNNIAAEGEAEAPADRLVLAPQSEQLAPEDQTAAQLQEQVQAVELATQSANEATLEPAIAEIEPATDTLATASTGQSQEPEDQASLIQATLQQLTENQDAAGAIGGATDSDLVPVTVAGVSSSPLPMLRPIVVLASLTTPAPSAPAQTDGVRSLSPAEIPVGTRLAQLGAFESIDIAKSEWIKFASQFEIVMADKTQVIEKAQSGGKVFYRLRAHGFENLSQARQFCSTLLAKQANCIPVVTR